MELLFRSWMRTEPNKWELRLPLAVSLYDYNTEAPPGGTMLMLQDPESYFQHRPELKNRAKPNCLAQLDDKDWQAFTVLISEICQRYWNDQLPFIVGMSCFLLLMLIKPALMFFATHFFAVTLLCCLVLLLLSSQVCLRSYIIKVNGALDDKIEDACDKFTRSLKGLAMVQFRVERAGHCRGRFARPFRGIVISPGPANSGLAAAIAGSNENEERQAERDEMVEAAGERNASVQMDTLVCHEPPETELKHFARRDRQNIPSGMGLVELKDRMEGDSAAEMVMELYMAMPDGERRARDMLRPDSHDDGRLVYVPEQDLGELKYVWQTRMVQARRVVERQFHVEGRNRRAPRLVFFHPDGIADTSQSADPQSRQTAATQSAG